MHLGCLLFLEFVGHGLGPEIESVGPPIFFDNFTLGNFLDQILLNILEQLILKVFLADHVFDVVVKFIEYFVAQTKSEIFVFFQFLWDISSPWHHLLGNSRGLDQIVAVVPLRHHI